MRLAVRLRQHYCTRATWPTHTLLPAAAATWLPGLLCLVLSACCVLYTSFCNIGQVGVRLRQMQLVSQSRLCQCQMEGHSQWDNLDRKRDGRAEGEAGVGMGLSRGGQNEVGYSLGCKSGAGAQLFADGWGMNRSRGGGVGS